MPVLSNRVSRGGGSLEVVVQAVKEDSEAAPETASCSVVCVRILHDCQRKGKAKEKA